MFDERGVLQWVLQLEKSEHITSDDDDSAPTLLKQIPQQQGSAPEESLSSPTPARVILQSSKAAKSVSPQSKLSKRSAKAKLPAVIIRLLIVRGLRTDYSCQSGMQMTR